MAKFPNLDRPAKKHFHLKLINPMDDKYKTIPFALTNHKKTIHHIMLIGDVVPFGTTHTHTHSHRPQTPERKQIEEEKK